MINKLPIYSNIETEEVLGEVQAVINPNCDYPYAMLELMTACGTGFDLVRIEQDNSLLHIYIYSNPSDEDYTSCITIDLAKFQEAQ